MRRRIPVGRRAVAAVCALIVVSVLVLDAAHPSASATETNDSTTGTASTVSPSTVAVGGTLTYTLSGFPPGATVQISVDDGAPGGQVPVQESVGSATVNKDGVTSGAVELPGYVVKGSHWLRFDVSAGPDIPTSEVRTLDYTNKSPYFTVGDEKWRSSLIRSTELNRSFAASCGWPVFHSTPDMGFDLPFSTWLPVVVDVEAWASDAPLLEREKPLVVHVPSQRKPPIKGTQFIDPVLRRLHDEGAIEYVAPSGLPHAQLRELVRSCDVVVDQVMFGSYGVAAVEAMAAGRVCVGRMNEAVRDRLPESPHLLEATPDDLYEVVASIRDRRDELRTRAAENRAFAEKWHDGRVSAERLAPFLGVG